MSYTIASYAIRFIIFLTVFCVLAISGCVDNGKDLSHLSDRMPGNSSITITDDLERTLVLSEPADDIVSLSSDATILLLVIGAGDTLTGVSGSPTTYPHLAEKMPRAVSVDGGYSTTPDVERIVSMKPDIVILMTSTSPSVAEKLARANIPYIYIDGYKLADIPREVIQLGLLTGKKEGADRYNAFYHKYRDLIDKRVGSLPESMRPFVYYEGSSDCSTVGNGSGGDSLIRMAYGRNIAGDIDVQWPIVSPEWIIQQNPQVMVKIAYESYLNNSTIQDMYDNTMNRSTLSPTDARKNSRIYIINHRIAYGPVGIITLVYMTKAFYPEIFTDIDPTEILAEYDREFLSGSMIDNPFYPPGNR